MKWNARPLPPYLPKYAFKTVAHLAWLPIKTEERVWVWLERYTSHYYWSGGRYGTWEHHTDTLIKEKKKAHDADKCL